jgi:hypothetical protein
MLDEDDEDDGSEEGSVVSVGDFADIIQVPLDSLLGRFAEAGMVLAGPEALVTPEMKDRLLAHMKKIRIDN